MKCPATQKVPFPDVKYYCTLHEGHEGNHRTVDTSGRTIAEWYTDDEGRLHIETIYMKGHSL